MIPKQMFFIWFGDNQPDYVNFAIKNFKEVNPSFKVNFLRYTISDLENKNEVGEYDKNVYKCVDYILQKNPPQYKRTIEDYKSYKRKFIQVLANILRLDLLNEYGGLYLDCDTFPLKPFSERLLKLKSFSALTFLTYDSALRLKDCHFMGNDKTVKIERYCESWSSVPVNKYKFTNDYDWMCRRQLFYDCKLKYKEMDCEYFIEHYIDRTWKPVNGVVRTPLCKYDKEM